MCNTAKSTLSKYAVRFLDKKTAEVLTRGGLQGVRLFSEDQILEVVAKYNPLLLSKLAKLGLRVYLHTLAGYKVTSTAVQSPAPQMVLPPGDIRLKDLKESLNSFGISLDNPRYKQGLQDLALDMLGLHKGTKADQPSEIWLGVAERAEQLGYAVGLVTRYRSPLGRYVKATGLECVQESRLCNGTDRPINLYKLTDELDNCIKEYLDAKILSTSL